MRIVTYLFTQKETFAMTKAHYVVLSDTFLNIQYINIDLQKAIIVETRKKGRDEGRKEKAREERREGGRKKRKERRRRGRKGKEKERKKKKGKCSNCNQILQTGSVFSLDLQAIHDTDIIPSMPLIICIIFYFQNYKIFLQGVMIAH